MTAPNIDNLISVLIAGQPIWVLALAGLVCLLIDAIWPKKFPVVIYLVGIFGLGASLFLSIDGWLMAVDPKAETVNQSLLVMDRFTLFFIPMVVLSGALTLLNALGYLGSRQNQASEFVALVLFSVVGMILLVASDHLIMNFIGLETMSLAVYVLVGSQKNSLKSNEAAIKYFIMGGVASAILLYGVALFYGGFNTLHLSELSLKLSAPDLVYLKNLSLALIFVGLLFKLAIVPFHFWTPDVYQGAPSPITGFMATGVKIAVFGFTLRFLKELNVLDMPQIQVLLSGLVVATLIVGNLVAILQDDVKRMLAYSSISHAGFLLFGVLAGFQEGEYSFLSADVVLFYLFGYLFMSLGAFGVLSLMVHDKRDATTYGDLRGLAKTHPVLAAVFSLFLLALMGFPGTVGFVAKYGVISLAVSNGHIAFAVVGVVASVVSAFYYLRPLAMMYFKGQPKEDIVLNNPETVFLYASLVFCLVAVIVLGFKPDLYLPLAKLTLLK